MNSLVAVVFFAAVAAASAGVIIPSGYVARTYSSPAIVAPYATAYGLPLAHHRLAYSAPLSHHRLAYSAPLIGHHQLAYSVPLSAQLGNVAREDTVVAGPSGTVATSRTSPALATSDIVPYSWA